MASNRLSRFCASVVLIGAAASAFAQTPTRVRGTIAAFDGAVLSVRSARGEGFLITIPEKAEIVYARPIALSEIKPGDFLGVTSARGADGALTALEVRRFPQVLNPGHRPFDGRDDQTMTNATVGAIVESTGSGARGRQLALTYDGGVQHITVSESASISELVPGNTSQLVPDASVNLTHDANRVAIRIQVSPAALKPPSQDPAAKN
jgi:hypothetical protein